MTNASSEHLHKPAHNEAWIVLGHMTSSKFLECQRRWDAEHGIRNDLRRDPAPFMCEGGCKDEIGAGQHDWGI